MGVKLHTSLKNRRTLREADVLRRRYTPSRWTIPMLKGLIDDQGEPTLCADCGANIREATGEGGPSTLSRRGWKWDNDNERWTHRCSTRKETDDGNEEDD